MDCLVPRNSPFSPFRGNKGPKIPAPPIRGEDSGEKFRGEGLAISPNSPIVGQQQPAPAKTMGWLDMAQPDLGDGALDF